MQMSPPPRTFPTADQEAATQSIQLVFNSIAGLVFCETGFHLPRRPVYVPKMFCERCLLVSINTRRCLPCARRIMSDFKSLPKAAGGGTTTAANATTRRW